MSALPVVTEATREFLARQYDDLGPDICLAEIAECLRRENAELLEMASKCATDLGDRPKIMVGFSMFYQLLLVESAKGPGEPGLHPLPCVTAETRDALVREIDRDGAETFVLRAITDMEHANPELMVMAHDFASRFPAYLGVMQGFALLYRSLIVQAMSDRKHLH